MKRRDVSRFTVRALTASTRLLVLSLSLLACHAAHAVDSVWLSDTGPYPNALWPGWTLTKTAGGAVPVNLVLTNQYLLMDTAGGGDYSKVAWYRQQASSLVFPTNLTIEARLRYVSGARSATWASACSIVWEPAAYTGNALNFGDNEIWLWNSAGAKGTNALIDTTSAPHTYRIECEGVGANSPVRIYQDGALVLSGLNYYNASWFNAVPRLYWGDGTSQAYGVSEWYSFRHNAMSPTAYGLGQALYGFTGNNCISLNLTNGLAGVVGVVAQVPAAPNNYVLNLAAHPQNNTLYGVINPDASPQLLRVDPYSGQASVVGYIQTTDNLIKGVEGIAINPSNGVLYVSARFTSGYQSPVVLTVSPETAVATTVVTASGTVQNDLDSICFRGETLYALDVDVISANLTYLYRINLSNGQATLVGSTGLRQLSGLSYNAENDQFYASDTSSRRLVRLSPINGANTDVGLMQTSGDTIYALAFATRPGPLLNLRPEPAGRELFWPSIAGARYQIEYASNLVPAAAWSNLADAVTGNGVTNRVSDAQTDQPSRFYRLLMDWSGE